MSEKDIDEPNEEFNSEDDHILPEEEIIGMDPNIENNEEDQNYNDDHVQLEEENSETNPNLENEEVQNSGDDRNSETENHYETNEEENPNSKNYYFHQYQNLLSEISDLKSLVENYQKHIEDLQQSSENYFAYNNILKTQVEEKSKKNMNLENELKLKNENIKNIEENLSRANLLLEDKQKTIIVMTNESEAEKSKFDYILTDLVEKLKLSEDKESKKFLEISNSANEPIPGIVKNYKNLIENQKETIKNYEISNTSLIEEKSSLEKDNEKFIGIIIELEKKIKDQEKSLKEFEQEMENYKIKHPSQSPQGDKVKLLNTKEKDIERIKENFNLEKEMLKESLNKKIFESEVELENYKEINKLLEQKNSDLQSFIRSQKGQGNEDFKKSFKEFVKKVKIYFVDYEYLIDKRIIGNILTKYFQKSTSKKIKKPLLETLSNMMDFDNITRKILGVSSYDMNNKTNDKLDSHREQLNDIDEMMERIGELNMMIENLK